MQPRLHAAPAVFGGLLALTLLISGCSTSTQQEGETPSATLETQSEAPGSSDAPGKKDARDLSNGSATVAVGGREFTFQLRSCFVYEEREGNLNGPGGETGSDVPSYIDGDFMETGDDAYGEFRINIGSDGQFQSSDEFISLGSSAGGVLSIVKDGGGYLASGTTWDQNGEDLGAGTLRFTCG